MGFFDRFTLNKSTALSYQDFWTWFAKNERTFHEAVKNGKAVEQQFFKKLEPKLTGIKEGIFYLTGMDDVDTAELILTADGNPKNIVFVEELIADAPTLPRWKFTAHKPALRVEDVNVEMEGLLFTDEHLYFYANELKDHPDEIIITIVYQELTDANRSFVATYGI